MLCKSLQQYSQYSISDGILKTSSVTPFIVIAPQFATVFSRPEVHYCCR